MSSVIRLGVTGNSGFIGSHLMLKVRVDGRFSPVRFERRFFDHPDEMAEFAARCDAIVHLAAVSRAGDGGELYRINMELTRKLVEAVKNVTSPPAVFFGSTTHIAKDTPYHASKRDGMALLRSGLERSVELLMPNAFGSGSTPFYNSVVSSFCVLAASGREPERIDAVELPLIYVDTLAAALLEIVAAGGEARSESIAASDRISLPELWKKLKTFRQFQQAGRFPELKTPFDAELWLTFQSYQ